MIAADYNGLKDYCVGCKFAQDMMRVGNRFYVKCSAIQKGPELITSNPMMQIVNQVDVLSLSHPFGWRRTNFEESNGECLQVQNGKFYWMPGSKKKKKTIYGEVHHKARQSGRFHNFGPKREEEWPPNRGPMSATYFGSFGEILEDEEAKRMQEDVDRKIRANRAEEIRQEQIRRSAQHGSGYWMGVDPI